MQTDAPPVLATQTPISASAGAATACAAQTGSSWMWLARRWPLVRRQMARDLLILAYVALLAQAFGVAWIMTDSVHASVALVIKGVPVRPGELAVFRYSGQAIPLYYPDDWVLRLRGALGGSTLRDGPQPGDGFVKYLVGVPGDRVEVQGRRVYLHTRAGRLDVGECKTHSHNGVPLTPTTSQVIPPGYAYMWAPHSDALDSRYSTMGLVPLSAIVGRAVRLL
jgi:conjugal transfer pilin signal peptidase TrbI